MSSVVSSVVSSVTSSVFGSASGGGSAPPSDNSYAEFTTETTATPSTTRLTVGAGKTAAIIWVGGMQTEALLPNEFVWLYVDVNGTVRKIKATRWQKHILKATAGDTIKVGALAVDDATGVAVSYGVVDGTFPTSLSDPTGSTGDANCDYASQQIWEPANAHVTLTDPNTAVLFNNPGADKTVFVSESENGSTGWTKPVELRLINGYTQRYMARYRYLAFMALTSGQTVNVTCAGTISGAANTFTLDATIADLMSGTTRLVSSSSDGFGGNQFTYGANLAYAIDNADSGDVILLNETASFTLSRRLGLNASSARYSKDIFILANTGITPTITSLGVTNVNDGYTLAVQGVTFNFATATSSGFATEGTMSFVGGTTWLKDCTVTGPTASADRNLIAISGTATLKTFNCTFENAGLDVLNATDSTSYTETNCCIIQTPGSSGSTNNLYTPHVGALMVDYGSDFTKNGGSGPAITPDASAGSDVYLFNSTFDEGTGTNFEIGSGLARVRGLHGCSGTIAANAVIGHYMVGCSVQNNKTTAQNFKPDSGEYFAANRFNGVSSATSGNEMIRIQGAAHIEANLFTNCRGGILTSASFSLAAVTSVIDHNTFADTVHAQFNLANVSHGTMSIRNNIFENSGADVFVTAGASGTVTSNGNIFGFSVDADYTTMVGGSLGANDANNTTPGINATTKKPNASGNCDNEGTTTGLGWFGGIGPDLIALSHSTTERPRGCFGVPDRDIADFVYFGSKW